MRDGAPQPGGMLGSGSMGAMRSYLNEILREFQEGSLGEGKNAAENILPSCTRCGVLTLT